MGRVHLRKGLHMFGDTIVLPHADGNITCTKINQDNYSSEYLAKGSLSEYSVRIRHSKTKPTATRPAYDRHNVEIVETIYATSEVAEYTRKVYIVIEVLPRDADIKNVDALADWLIATAGAAITKLLGWQS